MDRPVLRGRPAPSIDCVLDISSRGKSREMPAVNDSRAVAFTEIINEGHFVPGKIRWLAVYGFEESGAGSTSAPPNAVTRPRWSITIWVASCRISEAS